jgi:hypothetical protein
MLDTEYKHDPLEQCKKYWGWHVTPDVDVPKPLFEIKCDCGKADYKIRRLQYNDHGDPRKKHKFRCTVQYKCMTCSQLRTYGIVVSPHRFEKHRELPLYFYRDLVDLGIYVKRDKRNGILTY